MPLITLCGFPCVGKTTFAALLASHIECSSELQMKCVVINEESLHISKPAHYKSAAQEKILRQNLKSAVEHALNADTVVIFDSCNYIKGYRYELYCIARSQRTPHCVVHVSVENMIANQWNANNEEDLKYDQTLMEDIRRRFESPVEANRWDKPLFQVNMMTADKDDANILAASEDMNIRTVKSDTFPTSIDIDTGAEISNLSVACDSLVQEKLETALPPPTVFSSWKSNKSKPQLNTDAVSVATQHTVSSSCCIKKATTNSNVYFSGSRAVEAVVLTDEGPAAAIRHICSYINTAEAPQPTAATNTVRHSNAQLLYQIDKVSQSITQSVVLHLQKQSPGTPLVLKEYDSFSLTLSRHVSMAELQRHRRQYLKVNSQHPPETADEIGKNFLEFLSNQF